MNKALSILLLIFFMNVFKIDAQINEPGSFTNEQHRMADLLLKKSKKQKITAWILLGAGAGASLAGYIIAKNSINYSNPEDLFGLFSHREQTGVILFLAGVAPIVASVPFFIASVRNKKKANLVFKNESQSFLRQFHNKANVFSVGVNLIL